MERVLDLVMKMIDREANLFPCSDWSTSVETEGWFSQATLSRSRSVSHEQSRENAYT